MRSEVCLGVCLGLCRHSLVIDLVALNIDYLHAAEGVADCHIGGVAVFHDEGEAGVVKRLEALGDIAVLPLGYLLLLILRSAGRVDYAGEHIGKHLGEYLLVALDARADKAVIDKRRKAVRNGVLKCGGRVGHARNESNICKGGVLTDIGLRIILADILSLGVCGKLNAGYLALGIDSKRKLDGLLGVARGGGQAQSIAHTAGLAVNALYAFGYVAQRGVCGACRVIKKLKACRIGHHAEVIGDKRSGVNVQSGEQKHCHKDYGDYRQRRFGEFLLIFHF